MSKAGATSKVSREGLFFFCFLGFWITCYAYARAVNSYYEHVFTDTIFPSNWFSVRNFSRTRTSYSWQLKRSQPTGFTLTGLLIVIRKLNVAFFRYSSIETSSYEYLEHTSNLLSLINSKKYFNLTSITFKIYKIYTVKVNTIMILSLDIKINQ